MRIQSVLATTVRVPLSEPVRLGGLRVTERVYCLVQVHTDAGLSGIGVGYTRGGPVAAVVEDCLAPLLVGRDPLLIEQLWESMLSATRFMGSAGLAMRAISAVDIALWDLKGKAANLPVYRLLGGYREAVPVLMAGGYYRESGDPAETVAAEMAAYAAEGFTAVKVMIGAAEPSVDLARLQAARRAVGPQVALAADLNGVWRQERSAMRLAKAMSELDLAFLEEPLPVQPLATLRAFRAGVSMPIAAGEFESEVGVFRDLLCAEAADILRADATVVGGVTGWLRVAAMATAFGVSIIAHYFPAIHGQLAAATAACSHVECVTLAGGTSNLHELIGVPFRIEHGLYYPSVAPGFGFFLNAANLERCAS